MPAPTLPTIAFDASKIARIPKSYAVFTPNAGVRQVETATAVGTITTSGNIAVVITAAGVAGSPITLSVAALAGDTPAMWAQKVRLAIAANTAISALYSVLASLDATITLTALNPAANDSTLNIALADGTSVGVTTAATSTNTTPGLASGAAVQLIGKIFEAEPKTTTIDRKVPDVNGVNRPDFHAATEATEDYVMTDIEEIDRILAIFGGFTGLVPGTVQFFLKDPRDATNFARMISDVFPCSVVRDGNVKFAGDAVSKNPTLKFMSEKAGPVTWTPNAATA